VALNHFIAATPRWLTRQPLSKRELLDALSQEITDGEALLLMNSEKEVRRIKRIVTLQVRRKDGRMFARIGQSMRGQPLRPHCCLPGGHAQPGEALEKSIQRICVEKLKLPSDCMTLSHVVHDVEEKESKQFGVNTCYQKQICFMELRDIDAAGSITAAYEVLQPQSLQLQHQQCVPEQPLDAFARNVSPGQGKTNYEGPQWTKSLLGSSTYLLKNCEKTSLYAWLSQEEFRHLESLDGQCFLSHWLSDVNASIYHPSLSPASTRKLSLWSS